MTLAILYPKHFEKITPQYSFIYQIAVPGPSVPQVFRYHTSEFKSSKYDSNSSCNSIT